MADTSASEVTMFFRAKAGYGTFEFYRVDEGISSAKVHAHQTIDGYEQYTVTVLRRDLPQLLFQARKARYEYAAAAEGDIAWEGRISTAEEQRLHLDPIREFVHTLREYMTDELEGQPFRNGMRRLRLALGTIAEHDHIDGILDIFARTNLTIRDASNYENGHRIDMLDRLLNRKGRMGVGDYPTSLNLAITLLEDVIDTLAQDVKEAVKAGATYWYRGVELGDDHLDELQKAASAAKEQIAWLREHGYLHHDRTRFAMFTFEHDLERFTAGANNLLETGTVEPGRKRKGRPFEDDEEGTKQKWTRQSLRELMREKGDGELPEDFLDAEPETIVRRR
ncbi:MAG: hypothetical protein J0L97_08380 [Alphaproteobacteria bacterium]|nr:hypothetical protein [Alphaproteobacteria bacterium]